MSSHSASGAEWEAMKLRVWARDNYTCVYCGCQLTNDHGPQSRTVDHLLAVSKGGSSSDITNLVSACRSDNSSKGVNDLVRRAWVNPSWLDKIPA
jgi:5-methylcytosine-specific restriction endonuclease McrA